MSAKRELVERLISAWKSGDVDGVLNCVCDDVEYHFLVGERPLKGKDWVRRFLEKFGSGMSDIRWRLNNVAENESQLMVEGVDDYVNAKGIRVRTPYMGIFEFRDGKIHRWRDYADHALIQRSEAGEPVPQWLEALVG